MPHTFVIFGASGDLTSRKLVPALYSAVSQEAGCRRTRGSSASRGRRSRTTPGGASWPKRRAKFAGNDFDAAVWADVRRAASSITPGDIGQPSDFADAGQACSTSSKSRPSSTRVYYLATAPQFYEPAVEQSGRSRPGRRRRAARGASIIEKPFGTDLASAQAAERRRRTRSSASGRSIASTTTSAKKRCRTCSCCGSPTRSSSRSGTATTSTTCRSPWPRKSTSAAAAGYYDTAGVLRDMFQNHLLQLLMITAMEAPVRYEADAVRDEKVKVLRAIRPLTRRRCRQRHGPRPVRGYSRGRRRRRRTARRPRSPRSSCGSTTGAGRACRFICGRGKAMSCRTTQIVVQFREPPHMLFADGPRTQHRRQSAGHPGAAGRRHSASLSNQSARRRHEAAADRSRFQLRARVSRRDARGLRAAAARRAEGDASLFARATKWKSPGASSTRSSPPGRRGAPPLEIYPRGDWGPAASNAWMQQQGREWFDVCPVLH